MPSEIPAELDLPASGISRLQDFISLPKGRFTLNLPNEISAPNLYTPPDSLPLEDTAIIISKRQELNSSLNYNQRAADLTQLSSDRDPLSRFTGIAHRNLPAKLQDACKVCIDSAMLSTVAFDGIEGRPVVTNIFGTAHTYVNITYKVYIYIS
ncbi:unnamed protein product [Aspergillus oryzae]|uniref:Unnamed protein product n=1 Tax=Aspergillus oryzae var. brunneus TaxID=332754 RepID=A0ABQ6KV50_ASPOZ|nr:unnamed protein product [Aspergillus oryzae]GMF95460.1 unnamed protein product [Aspergillus oryzae]GMG48735.1 unnamed protein product [Aspergillus oryzae var. brunneus]